MIKHICPDCGSEVDFMPHADLWNIPPRFEEGDYCYECERNVTPIRVGENNTTLSPTPDVKEREQFAIDGLSLQDILNNISQIAESRTRLMSYLISVTEYALQLEQELESR